MSAVHADADVPGDLADALLPAGLLRRARAAPVYDVAHETPLEEAALLSARLGARVLLKREDRQSVFSFKLRGAYAKMAALDPAQRARGVVAASAGNHAQGVALAAAKLDIRAAIVMPVTAPQVKVDAVRRLGGAMVEVVLAGDSYSEAQAEAARIEAERGAVFVHPFDDLDVIAGQATVALELLRQHPGPLEAVFVPVGGGGLLAGVAAVFKALRPDVKVIGVQAADADAMAQSLEQGRRVTLDEVGLFADGTAVKRVGALTFALCRAHADALLRVDTDAICAAMRDVYQETRSVPEPSGALALAGLKQYAARRGNGDGHGGSGHRGNGDDGSSDGIEAGNDADARHDDSNDADAGHDDSNDADAGGRGGALLAIVSGANLNFDRLRFVAERAEIGERREAVFAVTIPEQRGSFRRFCATLGQHAVTEFNYRIGDAERAHIFVGVQTANAGERKLLAEAFAAHGFGVLDLTDDELAKTHLRHMVGGRSPLARDEVLYRFEFPERPGALMRFLDHLHPDWNVSLFHYRNHGADTGRILVGLQVPSSERTLLADFLDRLGYPYRDESAHPAYRLLLCQTGTSI